MRVHTRSFVIHALLLLAAITEARAQEAPQRLKVIASLGFVSAAGNNDLMTLSGDEDLDFTTLDSLWRFSQAAAIVYGRTDDSTTASALRLNGRVDRRLSYRLSGFAGIGWERNRFAGIARRFEEIVGLSYQALAKPREKLRLEGGASFDQQRNLAGLDDGFIAARAAAAYRHLFTEKTYFQQLAEILPNLETGEDLRINTESSLVAPLSDSIALKLSYAINYDRLPEPGFETTDRVFTSGLQVTF